MNYYIIPKNNFNIKINIQFTSDKIEPYISYSLIFYMNDIYKQLFKLQESYEDYDYDASTNNTNENVTIDYVNKIVNPFEFIHSNVPGSTISVSKVKADSTIFFELMELFQVFNINDILSLRQKINIAHLTHNYTSTNYLLNMLREENQDNIFSQDFDYNNLYNLFITNEYQHKLDLIICEFQPEEYNDIQKYINNMILTLSIVIKYQSSQGMLVIKIDNLFYKAIIDVIFILSGIYDKMYLVRPSIGNVTKGERYLICKGFNSQNKLFLGIEEELINTSKLLNDSKLLDNRFISSLIDNDLPYYLLNKLEESNLVIGQQQIEAYDQIINIFKNKNREEKIENLKRTHIQKCIQWCEKNQLPHNKFIDKINMFLSPKKKQSEEECVV
jgi:hypothetical protein